MFQIRNRKAAEKGTKNADVDALREIYVTGSGLVPIPSARINEAAQLIQEHHDREADRAKWLAFVRRA